MAAPAKSPEREEIEREVFAALRAAARPLTLNDLFPLIDSADSKATLARILGHMREAGSLARGPDVEPGQPGGMTGKGARACTSYVLTYPVAGGSAPGDAPEDLDTAAASTNGDEYAHPPMEAPPTFAQSAARIRAERVYPLEETPRAEADFAEPDPFDPTESDRWANDLLRLGELSDAALVEIADELLEGDRIWTAVRAMHRHAKQLAADWI